MFSLNHSKPEPYHSQCQYDTQVSHIDLPIVHIQSKLHTMEQSVWGTWASCSYGTHQYISHINHKRIYASLTIERGESCYESFFQSFSVWVKRFLYASLWVSTGAWDSLGLTNYVINFNTDVYLTSMGQSDGIKGLWQSDAIWWQRSGSTPAQIMACRLNQSLLITDGVLWHSLVIGFMGSAHDINL